MTNLQVLRIFKSYLSFCNVNDEFSNLIDQEIRTLLFHDKNIKINSLKTHKNIKYSQHYIVLTKVYPQQILNPFTQTVRFIS